MKDTLLARLLSLLLFAIAIWILGADQVEEACLSVDTETTNSCAPVQNESLTEFYFGEDMGLKQEFRVEQENDVLQVIQTARDYIQNVVVPNPLLSSVVGACKNKYSSCATWAAVGECEANPRFMRIHCAPVCQTCAYLSRETRCPIDPNDVDALYPGDLDKLFERITTLPDYAKYEPKVWSRPYAVPGDSNETAPYLLGPWLVTFEKFIAPEEANKLIELGKKRGYERSGLVRGVAEDGSIDSYVGDEVRTSSNTWCADDCLDDPVVQDVTSRIVNLTGISDPNYEFLQLLQYESGQFYKAHSDYIQHHIERQEGVRLLTMFMYLNDVEEGGGTRFPTLDVTVTPKQGRAALWPSVLNEDPNQVDERTNHESIPVVHGVKYGANAWIHQRDFKTPYANGCE